MLIKSSTSTQQPRSCTQAVLIVHASQEEAPACADSMGEGVHAVYSLAPLERVFTRVFFKEDDEKKVEIRHFESPTHTQTHSLCSSPGKRDESRCKMTEEVSLLSVCSETTCRGLKG